MSKFNENVEDLEKDKAADESNNESNEINKDEYIAKLNDDLEEQRKKTDEYFEHLKRNMADFDNFKKRITKERDGMYSTIVSDFLLEMLPILDNFEKAMNSDTKDIEYKSGIEMIYNQLYGTLKKAGLEEIETDGKEFDPTLHEAVMHVEDENYSEKQIIEVFRKGYKLGDKVIRYAMVKVAN